jgi:phospholipid/cholesterol/gamma-HCH transport system substrate-binding protein
MKLSIRFADQIVGAFVILALAILVFVVIMLGKSQRWFTRDYQYKSYFTSAEGLGVNMAVQYKGFTIGNVKKVTLTEDDRVEVLFSVFEEHYGRVKEGSLVEVQVSPIGLGNKFVFYPGKGARQVPDGAELPVIDSPEGKRLIAMNMTSIPEQNDSITAIMNQVNAILEAVNLAIAGPAGAETKPLEQIINNVETVTSDLADISRSISGQLNPILADVEKVTNKISDPQGTVMSVLSSEEPIYTDLVRVLDSISGIIKNVERTSDFIPAQLPQLASLLSDLDAALKSADEVMTSLTNNPLFKGGVPERKETSPGAARPRDIEF